MSDFALVIPASRGYLVGLNSILNGLDLWENTCAVEVVSDDIDDSYFDECRQAFDFPINVHRMDEFPELVIENWSMVRRLHFARYALAARLAGKYEAIMFLDADCLLVNNVMPWFELAAGSGLVIAAHNVLGLDSFVYTERKHTNAVPVANMPMFLRPDVYQRVFERTIEISAGPGGIDDMPALYYAIDEAGAAKTTVLLPDHIWLNNHPYQTRHSLNDNECWGGGKFYLYSLRERVNVVHKRWWSPKYQAQELRGKTGDALEIMQANAALWMQVHKRLNTTRKVRTDFDALSIL